MKIYREVLHEVLDSMPVVPPEAGGIIGGKDGKVCIWAYDAGCFEKGCAYWPDVDFLNSVIAIWMETGYEFIGILHVHFGGSKALSDGDKKYIEKIMESMPDSIERLYFPIVVQPEKRFISYIAYWNMLGELEIATDEIEICQ